MPTAIPTLAARCRAEAIGTFILVFFGCGVVHAAVLTGAQVGLWQMAVVWGIGIMLGIYVSAGISGAHINPAITVAFATWGRFPWREVVPYVLGQLVGAFLAGAVLYVLFGPLLAQREDDLGLKRGEPGSELTAMCYGEYFPNPGSWEADWKKSHTVPAEKLALVPWSVALVAEILGTAILALVVFAVTNQNNSAAPPQRVAPVFIGLTVAVLISVLAPLTQACFNPARDFGPRLFSFFAGWGSIAIPGPGALWPFLTVYILAPTVGAIVGGGIYLLLLHPHYMNSEGAP